MRVSRLIQALLLPKSREILGKKSFNGKKHLRKCHFTGIVRVLTIFDKHNRILHRKIDMNVSD